MGGPNSRSKEIQKLRRLTKNEKRLLTLFGLAIFVMANFYGISYLLDRESELAQQVDELKATAKTNQIWLKEKQFWLTRKQWIDRQQPRVGSGQVPQSELLQSVIASAQANQLVIQEQSFAESKNTPNYQSVGVKLKLSGNLENVVKWLAELQQPEKFQAITNFSLKSEEQPPKVSLELEVARWYSPHA
jgi:Tfp pilus assembly protein PilO